MKRDYVGEIALADKAVKKITELFHLQETKDWEIQARKEVLKAFDHIRKYYSQEDIK